MTVKHASVKNFQNIKNINKLFWVILSIILLIMLIPASFAFAESENHNTTNSEELTNDKSDECINEINPAYPSIIYWKVTDNVLYLNANKAEGYTEFETNSEFTTPPWYNHNKDLVSVEIESKIYPVNITSFFGVASTEDVIAESSNIKSFTNLRNLYLVNTLHCDYAFYGIDKIEKCDQNLSSIGKNCLTTSHMFQNSSFNNNFFSSTRISNSMTDISYMFYNCKNLTTVPTIVASNGINAESFCENCVNVNSDSIFEKISNDTMPTKNANLKRMFYNTGINTLEIKDWSPEGSVQVNDMFSSCSSLRTIVCSNNTDLSNVWNPSVSMFTNCNSLRGSNGSTINTVGDTTKAAKVDNPSSPGLFWDNNILEGIFSESTSDYLIYLNKNLGTNPVWYTEAGLRYIIDENNEVTRDLIEAELNLDWMQMIGNLSKMLTKLRNIGCEEVTNIFLSALTQAPYNFTTLGESCSTLDVSQYAINVFNNETINNDIRNTLDSYISKDFNTIIIALSQYITEVKDVVTAELIKCGFDEKCPVTPMKNTIDAYREDRDRTQQGLPVEPLNMSKEIFTLLDTTGYDITQEKVDCYCSNFFADANMNAIEAFNKSKNYIQEGISNNDKAKFDSGIVSYLCFTNSAFQQSLARNFDYYYKDLTDTPLTIGCNLFGDKDNGYVTEMFSKLIDALQKNSYQEIGKEFISLHDKYLEKHKKAISDVSTTENPEFFQQYYVNACKKWLSKSYACQIDGVKYPSLQDAFNNAKNGDKIILSLGGYLFQTAVLTNTTSNGSELNVELDLNSKTIQGYKDIDQVINLSGEGVSLKISDSVPQNTGKILSNNSNKKCFELENGAKLSIKAGTYTENVDTKDYIVSDYISNKNTDGTYTVWFDIETYKTKLINDLRNSIQDGDSENASVICKQAIEEINNTTYDINITGDENKNKLDNMFTTCILKIKQDRLDNFEIAKNNSIDNIKSLRDTIDTKETSELIDFCAKQINSLIYDAEKTPAWNTKQITNKIDSLKDQLYDIRNPEFIKYKDENILMLQNMILSIYDISEKAIVEEAIKDINDMKYDKSLNLTNNKARIDSIVQDIKNKINPGPENNGQISAQTSDSVPLVPIFVFIIALFGAVIFMIKKFFIQTCNINSNNFV